MKAIRSRNRYDQLFFLLTAIQAGMVWLHRSFPTQDGPLQIYLAEVLGDLIRGAGHYSGYYQAQGYAHPYSFSLYALMLLNRVFQPLTSEKILVTLYFVAFALGVRFLVRSVDARNQWLPLFLLPFAMNTYLCLGIYNFSFGIALMMCLMGLWLRWSGAWTARRSLAWLALLMLLASMHHVCVLLVGGFAGVHLAARAALRLRVGRPAAGVWQSVRWDAANAALVSAPLAWYASFALASARSVAPTVAAVEVTWLDRVQALMEMLPISPYLGSGFCFALLTLVVVPCALLLLRPSGVQLALKRAAAASAALWITAAVCLGIYILGPHFLFGHGHGYFAERLALPFVICAVAGMAPLRLPANLQRFTALFAVVVFAQTLAVRERETRQLVAGLAPLYDARPVHRGEWGAIVAGTEGYGGLTFNPYYWAGALYAQQGGAVLLNASWTYEPIALFSTREPHPWDDTVSPNHFRQVLTSAAPAVHPPLGFLCGGKWDEPSQAAAAELAQRNGMSRIFDSSVYSCYGGDSGGAVARR